jgi:hypothetical protein
MANHRGGKCPEQSTANAGLWLDHGRAPAEMQTEQEQAADTIRQRLEVIRSREARYAESADRAASAPDREELIA